MTFQNASSLVRVASPSLAFLRLVLAALVLAFALAVPAVTHAAVPSVSSGTAASCGTLQVSAMSGLRLRYITGNFPTGTTTGATYLAARLQTRLEFNGAIKTGNYILWSDGSAWMRTTPAQFPSGKFATGSTWYRSATINFTEDYLRYSIQARVAWLVAWPDGSTSTVYTVWATCF